MTQLTQTTRSANALYCAGCGEAVAHRYEPGAMLAISCRCGAYSPVLYSGSEDLFSIPSSLTLLLAMSPAQLTLRRKGQLPHLESYLGYSAHTDERKEAWRCTLENIGLTSQERCQDAHCKAFWARRRHVGQATA